MDKIIQFPQKSKPTSDLLGAIEVQKEAFKGLKEIVTRIPEDTYLKLALAEIETAIALMALRASELHALK